MIVVTGTKRSGTSMWMQILRAAGVDVLGEAFPLDWGDRLVDLNPRGFYETPLRRGINFTTNPDPQTGAWLDPRTTRTVAIKIFAPGVVRTDFAYLDRVLGTLRDWRSYTDSHARLMRIEEENRRPGPGEDDRPFDQRSLLPAPLEWWVENYLLVRDAERRRFPFSFVTYDNVLEKPEGIVSEALAWLGYPKPLDVKAAVAAVTSKLRVFGGHGSELPAMDERTAELVEPHIAVFDELFLRVHEGGRFDEDFFALMDETHAAIVPRLEQAMHERVSRRAQWTLRAARAAKKPGVEEV